MKSKANHIQHVVTLERFNIYNSAFNIIGVDKGFKVTSATAPIDSKLSSFKVCSLSQIASHARFQGDNQKLAIHVLLSLAKAKWDFIKYPNPEIWVVHKKSGQHASVELPVTKTCGDCVSFKRCVSLLGRLETDTKCDWNPSQFILKQSTPKVPKSNPIQSDYSIQEEL